MCFIFCCISISSAFRFILSSDEKSCLVMVTNYLEFSYEPSVSDKLRSDGSKLSLNMSIRGGRSVRWVGPSVKRRDSIPRIFNLGTQTIPLIEKPQLIQVKGEGDRRC